MRRRIGWITSAAAAVVWVGLLAGSGTAGAETLLERGTYLMRGIVGCGNCHTPKNNMGQELPGMELAGGLHIVEPWLSVITPNITQDKETGIGNWTDAQIIDGIRNGIRPDGSHIGPPMPIGVYKGMSDRDVRAVVAYLRQVKPVRGKQPKNSYDFPIPTHGARVTRVGEVSRSDPIRYGKYLAGPLGHCIECHTPFIKGRLDFENHMFAGGLPFVFPFGTVESANITPHKATGIGNWTDREIKRAITTGMGRGDVKLFPPMPYPYFKNINQQDLSAVVAYLRTVPAKPSMRKVRFKPAPKK